MNGIEEWFILSVMKKGNPELVPKKKKKKKKKKKTYFVSAVAIFKMYGIWIELRQLNKCNLWMMFYTETTIPELRKNVLYIYIYIYIY